MLLIVEVMWPAQLLLLAVAVGAAAAAVGAATSRHLLLPAVQR